MLRATLLNAVVAVSGALLTLARSKISAIFLGPDGFGVTAVMNQWVQLFSVVGSMVTGPALIGALAKKPEPEARARILKTAVAFIVIVNLLSTLASIFAEHATSGRADAAPLLLLSGVTSAFNMLSAIPQAFLIVGNQLRGLTRLVLITSLISTVLVALGTVIGGIHGQFTGTAAGAAITLSLFWYPMREVMLPGDLARAPLSRDFVKLALSLGSTSLISGFALQTALTSIRVGIEHAEGSTGNGLFQAAWGLNATVFVTLTGGLANYVFPRYGAAANATELSAEIESAMRFIMKLAFPVAMLALALHDLALPLLFSSRFNGAAPLIALLIAGNVPRAAAWVTSGPLMYRGHVVAFLVLELLAAGALGIATPLLLESFGLTAVGLVYFANASLQMLLSALVVRQVEHVRLPLKGLALAALFTAISIFVALNVTQWPVVRWAALALGVTLLARETRRLPLPWTTASSRTSAASRS